MAQKNASQSSGIHNRVPLPDTWYNITLGSTFKDTSPSSKFCSLRYEFKPASVDKSQSGELRKGKDNCVTVEYHNIQSEKPKVTFKGVCEDYKENDAVLIFDGESFRLERLHRSVKRLRHIRLPGEPAAAAAISSGVPPPAVDSNLASGKGPPSRPKLVGTQPPISVHVEQIDVRPAESHEPKEEKKQLFSSTSAASPDSKPHDPDENIDIIERDALIDAINNGDKMETDIQHQPDADDDIADVDISDDETDKGPNAAEALRAQVNASKKSSSSSSSSGSDSSGSASGSSSSSESESSDADSVLSV